LVVVAICLGLPAAPAASAELRPRTVAVFDRYVRVTEARMGEAPPFLRIDGLPETDRRTKLEMIRRGELFIERLTTREQGKPIDVRTGAFSNVTVEPMCSAKRFLSRAAFRRASGGSSVPS
jgi:hypothetical protein